jgi:hypothetical protein
MAPRSWELIALSLLAGLRFGLALDHGDLIFVAVFGTASENPRPSSVKPCVKAVVPQFENPIR